MQIKVGFEYETLVFVPDWKSFEQLCERVHYQISPMDSFTGVKTLGNSANDKNEIETNCQLYSDVTGDILVRFVLAAIYHRMQKNRMRKIPFKVQKYYHGKTCDAMPINVNTFVVQQQIQSNANSGMNEQAWNITPDSSVVWCKQEDMHDDNVCPSVVYESLEKYAMYQYQSITGISPSQLLEKIEVVSPPLNMNDIGKGILYDINSIMTANNKLIYVNNEKTSNHVHMSFDDGKGNLLLTSPESLIKVCIAWWYFEPIFMLLCGHWRRANEYAEGMRSIVYNYFTNPLEAKDLMETIDDETFLDKLREIDLLTDEDLMYMGDDDFSEKLYIQTIMNSIISFFQGDINDRSSRYAALNMLNMTNNGIGTIEVRIKQGSNDPKENSNFILLLTDFFKNVLSREVVTKRYLMDKNVMNADYREQKQKQVLHDSWRLWDEFLCKHKTPTEPNAPRTPNLWEQTTPMAIFFKRQPEYWTIANNMFHELMDYVEQPDVKAYWTQVFTHLHDPSRVGGGKRSKNKNRL